MSLGRLFEVEASGFQMVRVRLKMRCGGRRGCRRRSRQRSRPRYCASSKMENPLRSEFAKRIRPCGLARLRRSAETIAPTLGLTMLLYGNRMCTAPSAKLPDIRVPEPGSFSQRRSLSGDRQHPGNCRCRLFRLASSSRSAEFADRGFNRERSDAWMGSPRGTSGTGCD